MKKTLIFICLLAAQVQAQIHEIDTIAGVQAALSGPHPNLFEAQRIIEDWKAARPNALIGKTQKHWNRFYNFWKHRVTATGDPAPYIEAFRAPNPNLQACTGTAQNLDNISPELPDMQNWTRNHGTGILISLAAAPNSVGEIDGQILYAGTQAGGLFKSLDGGSNWVNVTDNIGLPMLGVTDIDIHPDDPNHLIITCSSFEVAFFKFNYGNGIFQSYDAGQTWTAMNHPIITTPGPVYANHRNKSILINPHNHNEYFLSNMNQIYRSCDKGSTWHLLYEDAQNREMRDMVILGSDPNTLFFLGCHESAIGSLTYLTIPVSCQQQVLSVFEFSAALFTKGHLRADKFDNNKINLFYSNTIDRTIRRLEWDGLDLFSSPPVSVGPDVLSVNPRNAMFEQSSINSDVFYVGWQRPCRINTFGNTVTNIDINAHSDFNYGIAINRSNGKDLLICATDGGIHVAEFDANNLNSNYTWQYKALNRGLNNQQIYGIAMKQTNPKLLLMNTQDEYAQVRRNDGVWHGINSVNEGRAVMIDYANPDIMYCNSTESVMRTTNGISYGPSFAGGANEDYWGIVAQHSNLHKTHFGINNVYNLIRSTTSGSGFADMSGLFNQTPRFHTGQYPFDMFSHPVNGQFMSVCGRYRMDFGAFRSLLSFSNNGGLSFYDLSPQPTTTIHDIDGNPSGFFTFLNNVPPNEPDPTSYWQRLGITSIAYDPNNPYRIFATFNLSGT